MKAVTAEMERRLHALVKGLALETKARYLLGHGGPSSDLLLVFSSNSQTVRNTAAAIPRESLDVWIKELEARGQIWKPRELTHEVATLFSLAAESVHRTGQKQGSLTTQTLRLELRDRKLAPSRRLGLFLIQPDGILGDKPWLGLVAAVLADSSQPFA